MSIEFIGMACALGLSAMGSAFGAGGKYHVRISYAYSMNSLRKAIALIKEFLSEINN